MIKYIPIIEYSNLIYTEFLFFILRKTTYVIKIN